MDDPQHLAPRDPLRDETVEPSHMARWREEYGSSASHAHYLRLLTAEGLQLLGRAAHYRFVGDGRNGISVIRVWNTNTRNGKRTWEAELSVSDLRGIAERFIDLILGEPCRA